MISESSTGKENLNVLLLKEKIPSDVEGPQDQGSNEADPNKHKEFFTETLLHKNKVLRIIARDDHVIDTERKGTTTRGSVDKK
jgi:hypothetical protein